MSAWKSLKRYRQALHRRLGVRSKRGQAMTEVVLLTVLLIGWGGVLVHFFPDSLNALQIYMDSFYFILSLPIP